MMATLYRGVQGLSGRRDRVTGLGEGWWDWLTAPSVDESREQATSNAASKADAAAASSVGVHEFSYSLIDDGALAPEVVAGFKARAQEIWDRAYRNGLTDEARWRAAAGYLAAGALPVMGWPTTADGVSEELSLAKRAAALAFNLGTGLKALRAELYAARKQRLSEIAEATAVGEAVWDAVYTGMSWASGNEILERFQRKWTEFKSLLEEIRDHETFIAQNNPDFLAEEAQQDSKSKINTLIGEINGQVAGAAEETGYLGLAPLIGAAILLAALAILAMAIGWAISRRDALYNERLRIMAEVKERADAQALEVRNRRVAEADAWFNSQPDTPESREEHDRMVREAEGAYNSTIDRNARDFKAGAEEVRKGAATDWGLIAVAGAAVVALALFMGRK